MAMVVYRRRCSPPAATSSFPYFPLELIPEVARWLTSLEDFFALRATCRAYRAVLPLTPANLASQAPLRLLVPRGDNTPAALFHFSLRRRLRFRLPCPRKGNRHNGLSSFGCRVAIWDYSGDPSARGFRIVHLLTGEQTRLPVPTGTFNLVLLSSDLVVAWLFLGCFIQYCRLGAADWRVALLTEPYRIKNLICIGGTFYALVNEGGIVYALVNGASALRLAVVELSDNSGSAELVFLGGALDAEKGFYMYLGECCSELILVSSEGFNDAREWRVFQWKSGEAKWVRITSLGGCALFFACHTFKGCLGPDHPVIRNDCMYFDEEGLWTEYSLVDGSFRRSDVVNHSRKIQTDFMPYGWIFPSMC